MADVSDETELSGMAWGVFGLDHSAFQVHIATIIYFLWTVAVGCWFTVRVVNQETASLLLGIVFVPVATIVAGIIVIICCYFAHAEVRKFLGSGKVITNQLYLKVQQCIIAVYGGYTMAAVGIFLSILPVALYCTVYAAPSLNDATTGVTIYPIVAPITTLQLIFYNADYFQLIMNMVIASSFFLVLLSGAARHFDVRSIIRARGGRDAENTLAAKGSLQSVAVGAPAAAPALKQKLLSGNKSALLGKGYVFA